MANLTPLPKLEALSPLVFRVLGCNPGTFTLQGTNTYLVGNGASRLLVDTGQPLPTDEYLDALGEALGQLQTSIGSVFCTHWHHDHVGGLKGVARRFGQTPVHKLARTTTPDDLSYSPGGYQFVGDGHRFQVDGATLKVVQTPGHTDDHAALWLEEEGAVFSGDCVLGEGTAVFEDLHTYMQSLQRLLDLQPRRVYPGHGPVLEQPTKTIGDYISHRLGRERQILDAFAAAPSQPLNIDALVRRIYTDIPESVRVGAANNVRNHLQKLMKEGRVSKRDNDSFELIGNQTSNV